MQKPNKLTPKLFESLYNELCSASQFEDMRLPSKFGECSCQSCKSSRIDVAPVHEVMDKLYYFYKSIMAENKNKKVTARWPVAYDYWHASARQELQHQYDTSVWRVVKSITETPLRALSTNIRRSAIIPNNKQSICTTCGSIFNGDISGTIVTHWNGSTGYVCKKCKDTYYTQCLLCGSHHRKKDMQLLVFVQDQANALHSDQGFVCPSCWSSTNFLCCSSCGAYGHRPYFTKEEEEDKPPPRMELERGGNLRQRQTIQFNNGAANRQRNVAIDYVLGSFNRYVAWNYAPPAVTRNISSEEGKHICKTCGPRNKIKCRTCNNKVPSNRLHTCYQWDSELNDYGKDVKVCSTCDLYLRDLHDYTFKPYSFTTLHMPNEKVTDTSLLFGIELELDSLRGTDNRSRVIHAWKQAFPRGHIYSVYDGTIRNGFEIVFMPMTERYFESIRDKIDELLLYSHKSGFGWTPNCGGHIHMNRKAFSTFHLYKFCSLFMESNHRSFIETMCERSSSNMCFFSKDDVNDNAWKCAAKRKYLPSMEHHSAISFTTHTIEIRLFNGYVNATGIAKNIQFLRSLYTFTQNMPPRTAINVGEYLKSCIEDGRKNKDLRQFLFSTTAKLTNWPIVKSAKEAYLKHNKSRRA